MMKQKPLYWFAELIVLDSSWSVATSYIIYAFVFYDRKIFITLHVSN